MGSIGLISRRAFLVTILSSMFWVTRVSPRSKKITLAGRGMNLPSPGPPLQRIRLAAGSKNCVLATSSIGLREHRFHVVRKKFLPPSFSEGSGQLKMFWAGLLVQGLERASQAFSHDGFLRVIKRECAAGQKSPAQIRDQGLFRAIAWGNSLRGARECRGLNWIDILWLLTGFGDCGWVEGRAATICRMCCKWLGSLGNGVRV